MRIGDIINIDKEILGGTPVFTGTRVPITTLLDHLEGDYTIEGFLDGFPSVTREQAVGLLDLSQRLLAALCNRLGGEAGGISTAAGLKDESEITNPETIRRIDDYEQGRTRLEEHTLDEIKAMFGR